MDTQRMVAATSFHRLAVGLTFDPTAPDPAEAWVATIGLHVVEAGSTAQEALDNAMNREALGPEPVYTPDSELDDRQDPLDFDPLPYDDWQILDA